MSGHTPGPWRTTGYGFIESVAADLPPQSVRPIAIPVPVAKVVDHRQVSAETKAANARLIAAAPELLAALKAAQCGCAISERLSGHRIDCWWPQAAEAIAKAEGR